VLLDVGSGEYFGVNGIGSLVWGLIDGRRTDAQIADAVRDEVHDPPDSLDADVAAFLGALRARHLAFEAE
jgi:Coenzyme PQQ synthesis protein D (PqqD)